MSAKTSTWTLYVVDVDGEQRIKLRSFDRRIDATDARYRLDTVLEGVGGEDRAVHAMIEETSTTRPLPTEVGSVIRVTEAFGQAVEPDIVAMLVDSAGGLRWRASQNIRGMFVLDAETITDWEVY